MKKLFLDLPGSIEIEFELTSHTGKKIQMSEYFVELEIVESINSFCMSGMFTFVDTIGLKEFLPLIGYETLKIMFRTSPDFEWFQNEFVVTKIGEEEQTTPGRNIKYIKVFFTSKMLVKNFERQNSKSYNHQSISNIVNDIYTNFLSETKEFNIEKTLNSITYIIPYWNPLQSIEYLMKRALSTKYKEPGYLFFEDKEQFNFVSLYSLYNQTPHERELIFNRNVNDDNSKHLTGYVGLVDYYEIIKSTDLIDTIKKGVTGSCYYTFDYATKSFVQHQINWELGSQSSEIGNTTTVKEGYINKESSVEMFEDFINDRIGNGIEYQRSIDEGVKCQIKNRILYGSLNENAVVVGKNGDSDLKCGMLVKSEIKSFEETNTINDKLSGVFLVKTIKHKITLEEGYKQVLLLVKSMFSNDDYNVTKKV